MKITILGSGTCVPRLTRSASSVLVESGRAKILVDLGPGTMHRLLQYGLTIFDLTHIFLTHFHPDHTAELVPLLFATKYPDAEARTHRLTLAAGTGLKRFYQGLRAVYDHWIVLPEDQMALQEIDTLAGETIRYFEDFVLTARPVNHRPESLAYRISDPDGRSMACSGDTDVCDALVDVAREVDLFICESAMPDSHKVPGHLTPSLAGRIAGRADARHLVLTHLYPECDGQDLVKQAAGTYKGPVTVAEDLMSFVL
ncbi:MBL fold metallo-hydrolase [Desulfatitalea tepidiphila]|uniref:MBL fold metallo-hydrolase n=1 Tax=Desulfatitalea tepidiphila TaxID=1185843 RepID=UPI0006B466D5|nr:ribonuclease Z [Desulfatitalea tepidiphila]